MIRNIIRLLIGKEMRNHTKKKMFAHIKYTTDIMNYTYYIYSETFVTESSK